MKSFVEKFYACSFFMLLFLGPVQGQITFEKTYGDDQWNYNGAAIQQTADGGYILFGIATKRSDFKYSWSLVKTDYLGEVQWQKKFGNEYAIEFENSVQQTSDGGYILCGSLGGPFTDSLVLMKTDDHGNQIWINSYPMSTGRSVGQFVQQTADGGFIVTGYTGEIMHEDVYVIKTDLYGTFMWSWTYGGHEIDKGSCVRQTHDGDYIVLGETTSHGNGGYDMYVLKLNSIGDTLWTKTYGTALNEGGYSLDLTADGGFISLGVGGENQNREFFAVKADAEGNEIWSREYGGDGYDFGYSVQQTKDGGYFMTGRLSLEDYRPAEMHCIKTNAIGDVLWERGYRRGHISEAHSAYQTTDGGYVVLGSAIFENEPYTTSYMYLVKVDSMGNVTPSEDPEIEYPFQIYPNPFNQFTIFKFDIPIDSDYTLLLFDAQGKELGAQSGQVHDEIYLKRKDLPSGVYFFKIISENNVIGKGKLIAQ